MALNLGIYVLLSLAMGVKLGLCRGRDKRASICSEECPLRI